MFSWWRSDGASKCLGVVGGQVPRLYGGTIFGGVWPPRGIWQGFESKGSIFQNLCRIFLTPPNFGILTHKLAQMCNYIKSGIPYFFFFFYGSGLQAMAIWKICHFWANRQIIDLHHEESTILIQCHLGICRGPFELPKATFQEFVQLTVFS